MSENDEKMIPMCIGVSRKQRRFLKQKVNNISLFIRDLIDHYIQTYDFPHQPKTYKQNDYIPGVGRVRPTK